MEPNWTDVTQTAVLAVQLLFLAVAAYVGLRQVREAKQLREEQIRPFVLIDFDVGDTMVYLTVSNSGTTLARNVTFEVEPPFSTAIDNPVSTLKMFSEGIKTLPPGKTIRTLFDSFIEREPEAFPDQYSVGVRYDDEKERRHFHEEIDLDLGIYRNLVHVIRHDIHHVNDQLKKMLVEMKKWRPGSGKGLLVLSPADNRAENEARMKQWEERRASQDEAAEGEETNKP